MANMLTTKECALVYDLLSLEENACKKARLYARTLTDTALSSKLNAIADGHEKRFKSLLAIV